MKTFKELQEEIILLNKNGINFLIAASLCWLIIALIWYSSYDPAFKAYATYYAMAPMMPLAYAFSRWFNTHWKIEDNPLNAAGLWLNLAQLFYFPFVFILLSKNPIEMPMALAIITGAHFFPYAWFYQTKGFAVMAGVIVIGSTWLGTSSIVANPPFWISLFMAGSLWALSLWSFLDYRKVKTRGINREKAKPKTSAQQVKLQW